MYPDNRSRGRGSRGGISHSRSAALQSSPVESPRPVDTDYRRAVARSALIAFFRIRLVTGTGRLVEDMLVPVRLPLNLVRGPTTRREARALAESVVAQAGSELAQHAREHAQQRARTIALESAESISRAVGRERAIAACLAPLDSPLVQAGLFDVRAYDSAAVQAPVRLWLPCVKSGNHPTYPCREQ